MDPSVLLAAPLVPVAAYGVYRHALHGYRSGWAPGWRVAWSASERAARRAAAQTRPTMDRPRAHPAEEFGRGLGRTVRPRGGRAVWASHEDAVLLVGPPRSGKTALLANHVLDAPGACVTTSTKGDVYGLTAALRSQRGRVWLFDPEALTEHGSTVRWSPVDGCEDPRVAMGTADVMVQAATTGGTGDAQFFEGEGAKVLQAYLYVAARHGRTIGDVRRWMNTGEATPLRLLHEDEDAPRGWLDAVKPILTGPAERTKASMQMTADRALRWLDDPAVAGIVDGPGDRFDIGSFVRSSGTLYLLAPAREHGGLGPLFAALTARIWQHAAAVSQRLPGGRLDPPLSLVLDEAANICPVPLDRWAADSGGRGIAVTVAVQSPSQLAERWGEHGKATIWQSCAVKAVLGGLSVTADLDELSKLCGDRDEREPGVHWWQRWVDRPDRVRRIPVLSPAEVRGLKRWHALVFHRSLPPMETVIRPAWTRKDVRNAGPMSAPGAEPVPSGPGLAEVIPMERKSA